VTVAAPALATAPRAGAPATTPAVLTVECRRDVNWSPIDRLAIDRLIDARPHVGVFLSSAWLSGLFAVPPPGVEPSVLVFREAGQLRGLVPLGVRATFAGVRITLLGGGIGSDRVDLLAARGYEARLSDMFLDWLTATFGERGFVLEFRDVPDDSPIWGAIRRAVEEKHLPFVLVPTEVYAMPYLALAEREAGSPDERAAQAVSLKRQYGRLARRGHLAIDVLDDADEALAALDVLAQMLRARWGAGVSALDTPRTFAFHEHVVPRLLDEGHLRMIRVMSSERTVAVCYVLAGGSNVPRVGAAGKWWGYLLAGYDRQWAGRIHLGRVAAAASVDLAARDEVHTFDFLKGAERFKYLWPVREHVSIDADLYSGTSRSQMTRAIRATRHAAVAIVKSVTSLF
jgi:hypothetical protein